MNFIFLIILILFIKTFPCQINTLQFTQNKFGIFKSRSVLIYGFGYLLNHYKEPKLVDISFNQVSESSTSLTSRFSLESFKTCYSDFQHSPTSVDPDDDDDDDHQYSPIQILTMATKDPNSLKRINLSCLRSAMDFLFCSINDVISDYENDKSRLTTKLSKYRNRSDNRKIFKTEKRLEKILVKKESHLKYYDGIAITIFKLFYKSQFKKLKSKDCRGFTSGSGELVRCLREKLALISEFLHYLSSSLSFYLCHDAVFGSLHLCQFIRNQLDKFKSLEADIIREHGLAMESYESRREDGNPIDETTDSGRAGKRHSSPPKTSSKSIKPFSLRKKRK